MKKMYENLNEWRVYEIKYAEIKSFLVYFIQTMHNYKTCTLHIYHIVLTSSGIVSQHGEDRSLCSSVHEKRVICMGNGSERADK
jgi:hypothetical protein